MALANSPSEAGVEASTCARMASGRLEGGRVVLVVVPVEVAALACSGRLEGGRVVLDPSSAPGRLEGGRVCSGVSFFSSLTGSLAAAFAPVSLVVVSVEVAALACLGWGEGLPESLRGLR